MQYELNSLSTSSYDNMNIIIHNSKRQGFYITPCIDTYIIASPLVDDLSDYGIPLLRYDRSLNQRRLQNYKKNVKLDRKRDEREIAASEGWRYPRQGPKKLAHLPEEFKVNSCRSMI